MWISLYLRVGRCGLKQMPIMHFHNGALVAAFFVASGCIAAPTGLAKVPQRRNVGGIDTDNNRLIQKGMVVLSHLVNGVQQAGRALDRIDGLDTSTHGVKQPQQMSPTNANEYGVKIPLPRINDANLAAEAAKEQAHHYEVPQPLREPVYETVGPPKLPPRNVRWQSTDV